MASERRLEILGILLIAISVFLLFSLLGYNPNEEPSISPNVKVENPMGILGLILSHMLVKLGFGYIIILIPIIGLLWGWTIFSKKDFDKIIRITKYGFSLIILFSISLGVVLITFSPSSSYLIPGLIGSKIALLFIDWLSVWGTFIILIASYLALLRGYLNIDYYKPLSNLGIRFVDIKKRIGLTIKQKEKEKAKRKHTLDLKAKIDAKVAKESINDDNKNLERTNNKEELSEVNENDTVKEVYEKP